MAIVKNYSKQWWHQVVVSATVEDNIYIINTDQYNEEIIFGCVYVKPSGI